MKLSEIINEGGGYIPQNNQEAHDPRWEMAITCDIHPNQDKKEASKFGFKLGKNGPPILRSNGKIFEGIQTVQAQDLKIGDIIYNYGQAFVVKNLYQENDEIIALGKNNQNRRFDLNDEIKIDRPSKFSDLKRVF